MSDNKSYMQTEYELKEEIKSINDKGFNKTMLAITIYLKLNGYAPKGTLEYLKDLKTEDADSKKASHKNDLLNGGGEGEI